MFRLMLLAGWILTHAHVLWRATSLPGLRGRIPRRILLLVGAAVFSTWFLRDLGDDAGAFAHAVDLFTLNWLGFLFLVASMLLAADLLTGFGRLFRRQMPRIRLLALVAGVVLAGVAFRQGTRAPVVSEYEVVLAGLPAELDGTTVAALADTHLGRSLGAPWFSGIVRQVEALRPDLVVLLGDISEGRSRSDPELVRLLGDLRAPLGVLGVRGNHEFHGPGSRLMEEAGVTVLRDRSVAVAPGLVVAGVDDLGTLRRRGGDPEDAIREALRSRPPGAVLYLSHTPAFAGAAAREGAGLMLSGHTHGGQLWPYGYLLRARNPLFAGRYEVGGMTVLVSRGTGTWGPRMRLWRPAEILRITLRAPALTR